MAFTHLCKKKTWTKQLLHNDAKWVNLTCVFHSSKYVLQKPPTHSLNCSRPAPKTNRLYCDPQLNFPTNLIKICSHSNRNNCIWAWDWKHNLLWGSNNFCVWNWGKWLYGIFLYFEAKAGRLWNCFNLLIEVIVSLLSSCVWTYWLTNVAHFWLKINSCVFLAK